MTPKEKAIELYNKYEKEIRIYRQNGFEYDGRKAKNCCLIAVDEIINYLTTSLDVQTSLNAVDYWREVKQEIEKL